VTVRSHRIGTAVVTLLILGLHTQAVFAASGVISPDVTVSLDGTPYSDDEVVFDASAAILGTAPLGTFPEGLGVNGYHPLCCADQLYTLDATIDLGGGVVAMPGDVVRLSAGTDTLEFDASAEGIPDGTQADAVTLDGFGDLLLSFDTTVALGGGLIAADEDLVSFDGVSFAMFFDGSAEGVDDGLDVDGASYDPLTGLLLLSFDVSGTVGGLDFDDEDVLEFDVSGPTWAIAYEGAAEHPALAAADVEAVPEPEQFLMLAAGALGIWVLSAHRARRIRRAGWALGVPTRLGYRIDNSKSRGHCAKRIEPFRRGEPHEAASQK